MAVTAAHMNGRQISKFPDTFLFVVIPGMFYRNLTKSVKSLYPINSFKVVVFLSKSNAWFEARRTLELSAELSVTRGCWRKLFPQVWGVMFCDFCHACHELRIFNMLNNFVHEWTLTHSVRAFWAISSGINANAHASLPCFIEVKMADVGENLDSSSSEDEEVLLSLLTSIRFHVWIL